MPTKDSWQVAEIMPRFYELTALGAGGLGSPFKIAKFKFGHDPALVNESGDVPSLRNIPDDMRDIANVFYEKNFNIKTDVIYSKGRLLFRCRMPEKAVTAPQKHSLTGLYDTNDNLVAISLDLPDWITPSDSGDVHLYINYPFKN